MKFETVKETAIRLNVGERAIQKWAKEGKINGAFKSGRDWLIPKEFSSYNQNSKIKTVFFPLLGSPYLIGHALEFIESIDNEDEKNIALAEYYYYTGDAETATKLAEPYLDSTDISLKMSAACLCVFSNLVLERAHLTDFAAKIISRELENAQKNKIPDEIYAIIILAATTVSVQFQVETAKTPPLENYLKYLKGGLKYFACYVLAYKAYLKGDYRRSLATADTALLFCENKHPLADTYLHIISTIAHTNLKETEQAKQRMEEAYNLARPDNMIMTFVEHYSLFGGMIEVFFKRSHPKDFEAIINATKRFNSSWYKIHNKSGKMVADNLTTTEFTIAMLYNRNWKIKEIAEHMDLSERTIKNYLQVIYEKLCINGKKGLAQYMIK